jgi:hypothetical protein
MIVPHLGSHFDPQGTAKSSKNGHPASARNRAPLLNGAHEQKQRRTLKGSKGLTGAMQGDPTLNRRRAI